MSEVYQEKPNTRQIVWSTNPYDPSDFYADKLTIIKWLDTGKLSLELSIQGMVHRFQLIKKMEPVE